MTVTKLVCKLCGGNATKTQLLAGNHISKTLCDLNKEVYALRSQVTITEGLRDRLSIDVHDLIDYGLDDNAVPDKEWLHYARGYFKAKLIVLNDQVSELQKVKDAMILHHAGRGIPVPAHQDKAKVRHLRLIS